jgi:hypothetical protein
LCHIQLKNAVSTGQGLDPTTQKGPSTLGVDTRYRSKGRIPDVFLRGAGVPGDFMPSIKSLVGRAFESYSCLISSASQDQEFAERLHADLQDKGATLAKGLCPLNFNH